MAFQIETNVNKRPEKQLNCCKTFGRIAPAMFILKEKHYF